MHPPTRCSDGPAITHVSAHTCSGEGEDNVSMQLVMAMQADGKHPPGPGQPPGTPHLAQRPLSRRPRKRFSIRLRGNTFFTSFDTSCPSGLWHQQPRVPCMLGADRHPSPTPAPLRGVGRAGTGPPALQGVPWMSLSPSLVGAGAQHGFRAAQRHQRASSSLQAFHLPSWASSHFICQHSPACRMFFCLIPAGALQEGMPQSCGHPWRCSRREDLLPNTKSRSSTSSPSCTSPGRCSRAK